MWAMFQKYLAVISYRQSNFEMEH
uniref:Uncharacterized protein n=1 Tax=Anguilla anguilla TaxID=7936 RepID=A0A0E9QML8_ANGAN